MKIKGKRNINFGKLGKNMFVVQKGEICEVPNTEMHKQVVMKGLEDGFIELVTEEEKQTKKITSKENTIKE